MKNFLLYLSIILCLGSCCVDDCEVDPEDCNSDLEMFSEFQLRAESLSLSQRQRTSSGSAEILTLDDINFDSYFFNLDFLFGNFAFNQPDGQGDFIEINEPQYCIPSGLGFVEKIENFQVITNLDYNDVIKAGDVINDIIILEEGFTLNDYLDLPLDERNINFLYNYSFSVRPNSGKLEFTVDIKLDSGSSFSAESPLLEFK